jgi:Response regulators consisting of a CheY-like receiver domain and a winged-helix DNA-binding domain
MDRVLIVDDEIELCELIRDCLEIESIEGICCYDGAKVMEYFLKYNPKVVILDIMLPKANGIELCSQIRKISKAAIIMLSARLSDTDKVLSLGFGADDYVTKPFSTTELVARIKAQIRRFDMLLEASNLNEISVGDIFIDKKRFLVKVKDKKVELSAKEFEILYFLALNKGQIFTKEGIFDKIWGFNNYGDINTVSVHIRKLREKIEEDASDPQYIKTVWGVGYKLED